ncbi:MAG TPA: hypothetical protein VGL86_01110 [Polyangia bacterium]|jgi:hypothetical protein
MALVPSLFAALALALLHWKGPFFMGRNSDPDYVYLLNALNVAQGKVPLHNDHPGTTVQVLGGALVEIIHALGRSRQSLVSDVIARPETYLAWLQHVMLALLAGALYLVGLVASRRGHQRRWGLLAQSAPLFAFSSFLAATRFCPEPLLYLVVQGIVLLAIGYLFGETIGLRWATLLGILLGVGVATKVTFLPLFAFVLLLLPAVRLAAWAVVVAVVTTFVATLPIVSRYHYVWEFMKRLFWHSGIYGSGAEQFLDVHQSSVGFSTAVAQDPSFFVLMLAAVALLAITWRTLDRSPLTRRALRALAVVLAVGGAQSFLLFKHPGDVRYMLPAAALAGLLVVCGGLVLRASAAGKPLLGASLALCVVCAALTANTFVRAANAFRRDSRDVAAIGKLVADRYADCGIAYYYASSSPLAALQFGNSYTGNAYSEPIRRLYPRSLSYDIWRRHFVFNDRVTGLDGLASLRCLVLQGTPFSGTRLRYLPSFAIRAVGGGPSETLYEVMR